MLQECYSFWLLLLDNLKSIRPIPRLAASSTMDDVRQAVITAHRLHVKWTVRRDATPARSYILPGKGTLDDIDKESQALLIDDGIHVVHLDADYTLKLRRIDTGEVVWRLPSKRREELRGLSCATHEGDIILMFQRTINSYCGQMEIWRYKGSGNCSLVYSLDIVDTSQHALYMHEMYPPHPPVAHGYFIRGVYAGRLGHNARVISVSNWLAGTHVSFKVTKVKGSLIYMTFVTDGASA